MRDAIKHAVGKSFSDRADDVIVNFSDCRLSRTEFVELTQPFPSTIGAARLAKVAKRLKITSVRRLFALDAMSIARVEGIGEATLWVLSRLFDTLDLNTDRWLTAATKEPRTWSTIKTIAKKGARRKQPL